MYITILILISKCMNYFLTIKINNKDGKITEKLFSFSKLNKSARSYLMGEELVSSELKKKNNQKKNYKC